MKHSHPQCSGTVLLLLAVLVSGCGGSDVEEPAPKLPAWLTEEEPAADGDAIMLAEATSDEAPPLEQTSLKLSLHPGDRFPLRRVVDQELEQASLNGVPQISRSHLELHLSVTVEDVQEDRKQFGVRYERVQYSHDIFGEVVEYDSLAPPAEVPPAALAYHAMVNDGFSFEHRLPSGSAEAAATNVIGFREFLDRCLQHVPEDQRQRVMLDIEASSGEQLVAEFVNQTIGLFPDDGQKSLGDTWDRNLQVFHPLPMQVSTVYTLNGLSETLADVSVSGTIAPLTALGQSPSNDQGMKLVVQGGHSEGHCTLFRDSGLPKQSRIERVVDMVVQTGGLEFNQQKRTVTTVETLPIEAAHTTTAADEQPVPQFQ